MKLYRILTPGAILLAMVSCNKQPQPEVTDQCKVNISIENPFTRTQTSGYSTTFLTGDVISISSTGLAADMDGAKFTVTSNGSLSGDSYYYNKDSKATFYAHYPASSVQGGKVSMTVASDQSTEEAFNQNDFLTATAMGDPADGGEVTLRFKHRLAMAKIIWNGPEDATDVVLENIMPGVQWEYASNELTTTGEATGIAAWNVSKNEFWAMVPSQVVTAQTKLLSITSGGKNWEYVPANNITFNTGTIKKITLTVKEDGAIEATFAELEIENWFEDSVDGGGEVTETVVPPVELMNSQNIVFQATTSRQNCVPDTWNLALGEGNTIEFDNELGAVHMNIASGNWWNNSIFYCPATINSSKIASSSKIFKLSFDVKASAAGKGLMVQVMKGDESGNAYFGIFNADPSVKEPTWARMYYPSLKEDQIGDYVTLTYWINFGIWLDTAGTTVTDATAADYEKVLFTFTINTGSSAANAYGTDFYLKNFSCVEVK